MTLPDRNPGDDPRGDDMDDLERLRRANPVPPDEVASLSRSARARATFLEITMETTTPTRPRSLVPVVAGVAVALVAGVALTVGLLSSSEPAPTPPVATGDPDASPPVSPGLGAMCVEVYSLDTLPNREFAFAGTVTAIAGDDVTFDVEEAFRGDPGGEVTLGGAEFLASINPDNPSPITVGDRVLVAGDGGFAWGCGFTQPYDDDVAAEWRSTLAG